MERVRLPTDSDLAVTSVRWAAEILERAFGESPMRLGVSSVDEPYARIKFADLPIVVDATLPDGAWYLQGPTREVFSSGDFGDDGGAK